MSCVCVGIFHECDIALHKNNECVLQPRLIKYELVLVLFNTTYNKITQLGIEQRIHNRKCSHQHHYYMLT